MHIVLVGFLQRSIRALSIELYARFYFDEDKSSADAALNMPPFPKESSLQGHTDEDNFAP
ncbi:hypothetical protein ACJIZ3_010648 [Penstemon smallii]|uniref:Uncharacterized protein n=1 Tax=Penstemon smallii TaxID=265156 RepID=A0ABD3UGW7_9LAMI